MLPKFLTKLLVIFMLPAFAQATPMGVALTGARLDDARESSLEPTIPDGYLDEVDFLDNANTDEIAETYGAPRTDAELAMFYEMNPDLLMVGGSTLNVHISRSKKIMTVSMDGKTLHKWPVTIGLKGLGLTPAFRGHPYGTARAHASRQFSGAILAYAVKVVGGIFIHATRATQWLGKAHSHGCIRLEEKNARTLYGLVTQHGLKNTNVVIE